NIEQALIITNPVPLKLHKSDHVMFGFDRSAIKKDQIHSAISVQFTECCRQRILVRWGHLPSHSSFIVPIAELSTIAFISHRHSSLAELIEYERLNEGLRDILASVFPRYFSITLNCGSGGLADFRHQVVNRHILASEYGLSEESGLSMRRPARRLGFVEAIGPPRCGRTAR